MESGLISINYIKLGNLRYLGNFCVCNAYNLLFSTDWISFRFNLVRLWSQVQFFPFFIPDATWTISIPSFLYPVLDGALPCLLSRHPFLPLGYYFFIFESVVLTKL
jgi:hypothetical protein